MIESEAHVRLNPWPENLRGAPEDPPGPTKCAQGPLRIFIQKKKGTLLTHAKPTTHFLAIKGLQINENQWAPERTPKMIKLIVSIFTIKRP